MEKEEIYNCEQYNQCLVLSRQLDKVEPKVTAQIIQALLVIGNLLFRAVYKATQDL